MQQTFECNGFIWNYDWLDNEQTKLSVRQPEPILDDLGIDMTPWPSDDEVSALVGKAVYFSDAGDHHSEVEGIFKTCQ